MKKHLLFILAICCSTLSAQQANVILILTDDQGWGDIHANGNDSISTPNLDKLAKESIQMEQFYVSPVCAPTRASLLTGRYALRTGVSWVTHRQEVMRSEETTIAEVFQRVGYKTALFGKWHNGQQYPNNPNGQGFDYFYGFTGGHLNDYFNSNLVENEKLVQAKGFITDALTQQAMGYIRQQTAPFFCMLAYNAPHSPFQCPDPYYYKYKKAGLTDKNAAIYGMVENIDDNLGRLLGLLDSMGIRENTFVVFLSDNGPNGDRYNGGLRGKKASVYEGGIRVPCYIHRRNFLTPKKFLSPAAHIDLLPTLAGLCEIPLPEGLQLDGINLSRILYGAPNTVVQRFVFSQFSEEQVSPYPGSVRSGKYNAVLLNDSTTELYDLVHDPGQQHNLADSISYTVQFFRGNYLQWYQNATKMGMTPPLIPVGYDGHPEVILPAHEATEIAGATFQGGRGWSNDWLMNWQQPNATASWEIDVTTSGQYEISIDYNANAAATKANWSIVIDEDKPKSFRIKKAFESASTHSPDRIPRGEVGEKEWASVTTGKWKMKAGKHRIQLLGAAAPDPDLKLEIKALRLVKLE